MALSRRDVLKVAGAVGSLSVFGLGYGSTLKGIAKGWWAGDTPADPLTGNAPEPEYTVDKNTGKVQANPNQYLANTVCVGCTSLCGVRVRVDRQSGRVLRVSGNPYHLLSTDPYLPFETPIEEGYRMTSAYAEEGLMYRSTTCGRGNAVLDKLYDPYRVLTPLKRSGPRGSGQWQPISFEQLVEEVVEGGNLFGEGQVAGLRQIRDLETPIDPASPELGSRTNRLAFLAGFKEGRTELAQRFVMQSFGSLNFSGHRGNCGLSMRAGYAALLNDNKTQPHLKPDFRNCEFILNIGTAPGNAGNPFKRQGKLVAEGRSEGNLTYVVVDPVLTNADSLAAGDRSRWMSIRPGTDGALVMGMIRLILEKDRYNAVFLSQPNEEAAKAAGEVSWSNATHLVIVQPESPDFGRFLRGSHLGLNESGEDDPYIVINPSGEAQAHIALQGPAQLFFAGQIETPNGPVQIKTSLQLLLEESQKHSLEEYSAACGIPVEEITQLAEEFTSHGRKAAADCHGGTMHTTGFYTAYATVMLNALIGNLNWKGGTSAGGGRYADYKPGPRYDMAAFPGEVKPGGARISRRGFKYEKTSEFKRRKEAGEKPYPAPAPWYPFSAALQSEYIPSALNAYPYALEALILWNTNPVYGQSGLWEQSQEALADPKRLPLIIAIDPFINETSAYADYVVPDTVLYETWGAATPWAANLTKVNSLRWPVVDAPLPVTPSGDPVCLESFLIAVALRMGLPGFGEASIPGADGNLYPLMHPEDWHLRVAANMAFDKEPVSEIPDHELQLTGLNRIQPLLERTLLPDEWRRVATVLARGGRFEAAEKAYEGEWLAHRYNEPQQIYCEPVGTSRNSLTGERFSGTPTWLPAVQADGAALEELYPPNEWPLLAVSTKSQLVSASIPGTPRLEAIHPSNYVVMHPGDTEAFGLQNGDKVKVSSPGGEVEGVLVIRRGLHPGTVGIEHGYGHWALGAQSTQLGSERWHASQLRGAGVAINRLGLKDSSRQGVSTLADIVVGSNARQAIPVKVERITS